MLLNLTMLKNTLTSVVAVAIVSAVVFAIAGGFGFFKNSGEVDLNEFDKEFINNSSTTSNLSTDSLSQIEGLFGENKDIASNVLGEISFSNDKLLKYANESDALLKDALKHPNDEEREILIEIIKDYNSVIHKAFGELDKNNYQQLAYTISLTNSHILTWSPYFYYLHSQSKSALLPIIKELKSENQQLLEKLLSLNPELAGKLSTQRLKLILEDIARSGRKRNSDFVRFSYADYQEFKVFFDTFWDAPEFREGFAKEGYVLFDSFYSMHRDVDPEHNEEVRGWLNAARLELIKTNQESLLELASKNKDEAKSIGDNIIKILEEQLELRKDQHIEVRTFVERDLNSYTQLIF